MYWKGTEKKNWWKSESCQRVIKSWRLKLVVRCVGSNTTIIRKYLPCNLDWEYFNGRMNIRGVVLRTDTASSGCQIFNLHVQILLRVRGINAERFGHLNKFQDFVCKYEKLNKKIVVCFISAMKKWYNCLHCVLF